MFTLKWMTLCAAMMLIGGCAGQNAAAPAAAPASQAVAGCNLDMAKICSEAKSAGTLEAAPAPMGYVASQSTMPDTAHVAIPNGPTLQVMCYYNPQHSSLAKTDWTSSSALDQGAVGYLKGKGYCSNP